MWRIKSLIHPTLGAIKPLFAGLVVGAMIGIGVLVAYRLTFHTEKEPATVPVVVYKRA